MYANGKCGSIARSSMHTVVFLPENVTFEQACAIPGDVVTATHALQSIAKLEVNDTVLLDCSGSLLRAALSSSKSLGLKAFVLTQSLDEKFEAERETGLPPSQVLVSRTPFQHQLKASNGGRGVDAVISTRMDIVCAKTLSTFGTYVRISSDDELATAPSFAGNITLVNLNIATLIEARPKLLQPTLQATVSLAAGIKQDGIHKYSASELTEAFEKLSEVDQDGKVVLTFDCENKVQVSIMVPLYS
jgi:NADPH:quinone reductase-like Zn-dependent oxidoreductase